MGSVDCWPLAIILTRHLGVSPDRYPASAVTGERYPPLERRMSQVPKRNGRLSFSEWVHCGGPSLGELSGGNWMAPRVPVAVRCSGLFSLGVEVNGGFHSPSASFRLTTLASLHSWGGGSPVVPPLTRVLGFSGSKIVTWLILPVVICLSQRLSHACLSISNLYSETANGSLNQLSFI